MKRFSVIIVVISVIFMMGCGNRSQNAGNTSGNPSNLHGTYIGVLPCADCEGIETEIILNKDNTYIKKTKYLGKGNQQAFEVKGKYTWSKSENGVILEGISDAPNKYFVEEGALVQADMDGKRITGEAGLKYILRK